MIILGIGSNLSSKFGNRFTNIDLAVAYLEAYKINVIKKSSFYETPSYPDDKNPKFINIVIAVSTELPPEDLASVLLFIEEKLGRKRVEKNAPRTCDIDIIDYNGQNMNFEYNQLNFSVPHTMITSRNFVLIPLNEILPEWKHPTSNKTITTLIDRLTEHDKNSILKVEKS